MKKNYLIFMPSLMRDGADVHNYTVKEDESRLFVACQTNIPATEYVIELLSEQNESLDKIIMFCSNQVLSELKETETYGKITTIDYYKKTIIAYLEQKNYSETQLDNIFEVIPLNDINPGDKNRMDALLNNLFEQIDKTGNLYVDYTGGMRSAAILLIFFTRYLQKDGMNIRKVLYSNIVTKDSQGNGVIEDYMDTFMLFEWLDAEVNAENGNLEKIQQMAKKAGMSKIETVVKKEQQTNMKIKSQQYDSITAEEKKEIDVSKEQSLYQKNVLKALNKNKKNNTQDDLAKKARSGDVTKALQDIKERGHEKLISSGIIKWEGKKEYMGNQFYAYVSYYISYMEFAEKFVKKIKEEGIDSIESLISEQFKLKPANTSKMSIKKYIIREFEEKNKSIVGTDGDVAFLEKMEYLQTYCSGGFPFGNIQNNYSYSMIDSKRLKRKMWYADEYKREFRKKIREFAISLGDNDSKSMIELFPPIDMGLFELKKTTYEELGKLLVIMNMIRKDRNDKTHRHDASVEELEASKQLVYDYEEWIEKHKGGIVK